MCIISLTLDAQLSILNMPKHQSSASSTGGRKGFVCMSVYHVVWLFVVCANRCIRGLPAHAHEAIAVSDFNPPIRISTSSGRGSHLKSRGDTRPSSHRINVPHGPRASSWHFKSKIA